MAVDNRTRIDLAPEEARQFLRRLASDDEFRAQIEANPEKVLGENGISVSASSPQQAVRLPAKAEIEAVAGATQGQSRFRVSVALREAGLVAETERGPGEFGPPQDDSDRLPGEFGPPPGEFGPPTGEFGPPPGEFGPPPDDDSKDDKSE